MDKNSFYIALAGNPNCGKTTLFNLLTGSSQYVGNWPGVTVEKKIGKYTESAAAFDVMVVDLPGIYSLSPYSPEEIISRNYITDEKPELIINIIDATNIERNLYLTTQLAELGIPIIIALNMYDLLKSRGVVIDCEKLQKKLGIPVFPIAASKGDGVKKLMHASVHMLHDISHTKLESFDGNTDLEAIEHADKLHMAIHSVHCGLHDGHDCIKLVNCEKKSLYAPYVPDFYPQNISDVLDEIGVLIGKERMFKGVSTRFVSVKMFEGDAILKKRISLSKDENIELERICSKIKTSKTVDRQMIIADNRYKYICNLCESSITYKKGKNPVTFSNKIDQIVTSRFLALPIFALIVFLIFHLTFASNLVGTSIPSPGVWLHSLTEQLFVKLSVLLSSLLTAAGASMWIRGLLINGIIGGVGSVLSFTPQILLLFLFLSILEDSGYMARAAFIMDYPARKIGLSGRSFMPLMMGFGCSVPAIMGCRTLESNRDRKMTMMLVPFMSCGAKMPIYLMITAAMFKQNADIIIFSLYALGILVAIGSGFLLKSTVLRDKNMTFVMELPTYHIPSFKSLMLHLWEKLKEFLIRAGTILLTASVIIWLLSNFNFQFKMVGNDMGSSMLSIIGSNIAVIFKPLGFAQGADGWKSVVAIISGIAAKEAVVSTCGLLNYIPQTALAAFSFMAFNLLTIPCIAAVTALKTEMHSIKNTVATLIYWFSVSWIICFLIYNIGILF